MKKNNYLFYSEYLKGKSLQDKEILVSKTKTSSFKALVKDGNTIRPLLSIFTN